MPGDDPATDDSSPASCTFTADDLNNLPSILFPEDPADRRCSRPVWGETDSEQCIWHADQADKPSEELAATVGDGNLLGARVRETDLTEVSFPEGVTLVGADFTDADLRGADLTDAGLDGADLTDAFLLLADLTDADLRRADFTDAILNGGDLTDADLGGANLTGAGLYGVGLTDADLDGADLTDADLTGANLTGADLREADLSDIKVSRATQCGDFPNLRETEAGDDADIEWDRAARAYHGLKTAFAANGLIGRARDYHFLERDAREREAKVAKGGLSRAYLGSKASRYLTGYGVRPTRVGLLMLLLFVFSTVVYWDAGVENYLRYSVTTFTTSPPEDPPPGILTQATAMAETFLGTLLIVLLGYVLGNRERF